MELFNNLFVFDIETDSLFENCTTFWCAVSLYKGEVKHYVLQEGLQELSEDIMEVANVGDIVVGHNIIDFDLPAIEKLTGRLFQVKALDTLIFSRLLQPERRGGHSLEAWGQRLGFSKLEYKDFSAYSEEMLRYCERDTMLSGKVCARLLEEAEVNDGKELDRLPVYRASYRPDSLGTSEVRMAV